MRRDHHKRRRRPALLPKSEQVNAAMLAHSQIADDKVHRLVQKAAGLLRIFGQQDFVVLLPQQAGNRQPLMLLVLDDQNAMLGFHRWPPFGADGASGNHRRQRPAAAPSSQTARPPASST